MADRVKVTDPYTGTEVDVPKDSPQARVWGQAEPKRPARKPAKKSDD